MLSQISQGHHDLADLLDLIAFIVTCVGIVLTILGKPIQIPKLLAWVAAALVVLALFLL